MSRPVRGSARAPRPRPGPGSRPRPGCGLRRRRRGDSGARGARSRRPRRANATSAAPITESSTMAATVTRRPPASSSVPPARTRRSRAEVVPSSTSSARRCSNAGRTVAGTNGENVAGSNAMPSSGMANPDRGSSTRRPSASHERVDLDTSPPLTLVTRRPGDRCDPLGHAVRKTGRRPHEQHPVTRSLGTGAARVGPTGTGATGRNDEDDGARPPPVAPTPCTRHRPRRPRPRHHPPRPPAKGRALAHGAAGAGRRR